VGVHSLVLWVLSKNTQKLHSQLIRVSLTCQSHRNLTRILCLLLIYSHLSRICFSLSHSHRILISLPSRAHFTLLSLSTCDSSKVVQDFVHQPNRSVCVKQKPTVDQLLNLQTLAFGIPPPACKHRSCDHRKQIKHM
jgi:hypothetical protein